MRMTVSPSARVTAGHRARVAGGAAEHVALWIAVGETVILLHPPLPSAGVSIAMERERQHNDSLANGYLWIRDAAPDHIHAPER